MLPKIKILIEGYATETADGWIANSACCLITTDQHQIITDPGCNREKLMAALDAEGLSVNDINFVFLSHAHPDHILLGGIFPRAKYVTFDGGYDKDRIYEYEPNILGPDIEILETPGHVLEHLSLIVNTDEGKVAIAGDVIWWTTDEEQKLELNQPDKSEAAGMNMVDLIESRKLLLEKSDYIIPGHGKMFKVEK